MQPTDKRRVGYVVKRYPRFSETFIVNEILAHEAAGLDVEIHALGYPAETHFQGAIARVRAPLYYLQGLGKGSELWNALNRAAAVWPNFWQSLARAEGQEGRYVMQAIHLALAAHENGLTHLHAHFATAAATVARLAAHFSGLPYTLTAHAKDIFHESIDPDDLRAKLRDAAAVVTVSDYNVDFLRRHYGAAAARVVRVYNGLDLALFPYEAPADRPPRILGVGRLVEKKGFDVLIDACALLKARGRIFSCRIIGTGLLEEDLHARVAERDVADCVELLGPRPQREVVGELRQAAAFAAPCVVGEDGNRDGLPTVLLEAMALGTPCVSTDVTGIPEVLRDGETGLFAPQRDPERLADALERLLDDAALRVRLAASARRLIEAEFDVERNAAEVRRHFAGAPDPVASESMAEVC